MVFHHPLSTNSVLNGIQCGCASRILMAMATSRIGSLLLSQRFTSSHLWFMGERENKTIGQRTICVIYLENLSKHSLNNEKQNCKTFMIFLFQFSFSVINQNFILLYNWIGKFPMDDMWMCENQKHSQVSGRMRRQFLFCMDSMARHGIHICDIWKTVKTTNVSSTFH